MKNKDLVQVVRCKDCEYFRLLGGNSVNASYNWCNKHRSNVVAEDFCSYGERKEDD